MTVRELMEALAQMPENAIVRIQGDSCPEIDAEEITMSRDSMTVVIG